MSIDDQEVLRTYLQRVMELSEERSVGLTEEQLKAIAREVGISDADLAAAEQSAEDHRLRGVGFLEHERFDDAIGELSDAAALAPSRLDIKHELARAYAGRFHLRGEQGDRQQAEVLARRRLELEPRHQGSFELLNELDRAGSPAPVNTPNPRGRMASIALVGMLLLAAGSWLFRTSGPSSSNVPPTGESPVSAPRLDSAGSDTTEPDTTGSDAEPDVAKLDSSVAQASGSLAAGAAELDIPLELETGLKLGFDVRLSRLNHYPTGKSFFTVNAVIENRGATELEKIAARLDLRDETGRLSTSQGFELLSSSAPPLRPGDAHALHLLREVPSADVRGARLVVERVDQTPAASGYGVPEALQVHWPEGQPSGMEIAAGERSQRFSESTLGNKSGGFFETVLEIENTGSRTIRALKLKCSVSARDGRSTKEIERHVVLTQGPDLRTGGKRVVRFLGRVEEKPTGYELSVIDIR